MKTIKTHLETLEQMMKVAKEARLFADLEKIKKKHKQISKSVRCLSVNEL
jgi:uncharacterized membrane protein (DUF106 family)